MWARSGRCGAAQAARRPVGGSRRPVGGGRRPGAAPTGARLRCCRLATQPQPPPADAGAPLGVVAGTGAAVGVFAAHTGLAGSLIALPALHTFSGLSTHVVTGTVRPCPLSSCCGRKLTVLARC